MGTKMILESLSLMAWRRAKGELLSMLETYYPDYNSEQFDKIHLKIKNFIKEMEEILDER